jgi:transcriptional regulator with XRE-family HTH domain
MRVRTGFPVCVGTMSRITAELSRALAAVIKKRRVAKGLSLTKLAELSGLTQTYPGMIEKGDRVPTVDVAHAIARSLDVPLSDLIKEAEKLQK